MGTYEIVTCENREKWDDIVKGFRKWDVNYLNAYARAFQLQGHGEPLLFHYHTEQTDSINVVMKRDIANADCFAGILEKGRWFDLSSPYGYGGIWTEGPEIAEANLAYESFCKAEGFVCEFTRFHLLGGGERSYSGTVESHTRNIICELTLSEEEMLTSFEHKVRKNLKKAAENGLEICIDENGKDRDAFLEVYHETMDRTNAEKSFFFPEEFFLTLEEMRENTAYFHVRKDGEIISTELVIYGPENCYSFLGGTKSAFFDLRPNEFLKFEIIKWAKKKGLKRFVLGGGYGNDDGIFRYKKSFAPYGIVPFYIGKRIFRQDMYEDLTRLRGETISNPNFFPQYRG